MNSWHVRPPRSPRSRVLLLACLLTLGWGELPAAAQAPDPVRIEDEDVLAFNFEQVDIRVFTQLVGQFVGQRFVVAEDVVGTVTVVSPHVPRSEVFRLFVAVLESTGHTVIAEDGLHRVVRLPDRRTGMGTVVGQADQPPETGLITRILRLEHVTANEMRKLLEVHLERKDAVSALDETNHLVVTETAATIRRVEQLVTDLDRPGSARATEVIALEHADAVELAQQLSAAMAETQSRADQLLQRIPPTGTPAPPPALRPPTIVPAAHANRLIVSGTPRQLQTLRELVAEMDVDAPSGRSHLNVLFLNYIKAEDAARSITTLLDKAEARGQPGVATARRIAVEASEGSNALLVDASPHDFDSVRRLVETLDIPPRQVHISVLIAEVAESHGLTLGVEMSTLALPDSPGDRRAVGATRVAPSGSGNVGLIDTLAQGIFGQGISIGIAQGSYVDANGNVVSGYPGFINIQALKQDGRVKILSETSLGAQNNQEASVAIVDEIPVLESTIQGGSGTARDIIQNIKRIDVGVKLRMVPHIIPGGMVRLELEPSIEAVTSAGDDLAPTISKRTVSTTVTVPDGRTIVIAGLTRNDVVENKRAVPILGRIPFLGWLFRWDSTQETRTNILIFVTPRIVDTDDQADAVRETLERRSGLSDLLQDAR